MKLTSLNSVLEGLRTVQDELLQVHGALWDLQLEQLLHILWVMEVEDTLVSVIRLVDKVQKDIDDLEQEFFGLRHRSHVCRQQICGKGGRFRFN